MQPVSKFRGSSGEVVRSYVSPVTYVSALPVVFGILALGWICKHFGKFGPHISMPVISIFIAMVTMRFAIPASRGETEPTNESGEILTYVGRYLLLNLAWYVPWFILWKLLTKASFPPVAEALFNPMSLMQSPLMLLIRVILLIVALLVPTLCLLITLYSNTTKGLFSAHSWRWLLEQRRADLVTFWSSLIGGSLVMMLCTLIPALILSYAGFKDSASTGLNISGFVYLWIISTIPILNGRLAGTFVAHDFIQLDFFENEPLTVISDEEPLPQIVARPIEPRPDFAGIERRLAGLEDELLPAAMIEAAELETSLVAPIRGQIEQMLLSLRSGDVGAARNFATLAIDGTAQRGFADISMKLFEKMGSDRRKLKLAAYSLEILGNMYQQKKQLLDAAWCFHAGASTAGDTMKAQKRLFQIAEIAEKNGNHKDALTLYEILIKQYPDSTLMEFAQQGATRLKKQPE